MKVKKSILEFLDFISNILLPNKCTICAESLDNNEKFICSNCVNNMTLHQNSKPNFFCLFYLDNSMKKIIHLLKYDRRYEIGFIFGRKMGQEIQKLSLNLDCPKENIYILPVPIHKKREKTRGYNQSFYIAKGFETITKYKILDDLVKRTLNTVSQTTLSKRDRLKNVNNIFQIDMEILKAIPNHSIFIIIDDIITTGATTSSIANLLTQNDYKNHFSIAIATSALRIKTDEEI